MITVKLISAIEKYSALYDASCEEKLLGKYCQKTLIFKVSLSYFEQLEYLVEFRIVWINMQHLLCKCWEDIFVAVYINILDVHSLLSYVYHATHTYICLKKYVEITLNIVNSFHNVNLCWMKLPMSG